MTSRGAPIWRAASGSKPDAQYLTPVDAEEALNALLSEERKTKTPRVVRGKTWGEAADAWLDEVETVKGRKGTTLAGYRASINKLHDDGFLPRETLLRLVTPQLAESIQTRLLREGRLSRQTIYLRMFALRATLKHAHRQGWTAVADLQIIPAPQPHPDFHVLEPSQVEAIARAVRLIPKSERPLVRGPKPVPGKVNLRKRAVHEPTLALMKQRRAVWASALRFMAYTGLRAGEIRALQWRDVDFVGGVVRVSGNAPQNAPKPKAETTRRATPKGKAGRSLPLIDQAVVALNDLDELGLPSGPRDLVFPSGQGTALDTVHLRNAFYAALSHPSVNLGHLRAGDDPIVLHDLRHTFGTIAARVFPLPEVQSYLGHKDIKTTMRYTHFKPRTAAATELSKAFARDLNSDPLAGLERAAHDLG